MQTVHVCFMCERVREGGSVRLICTIDLKSLLWLFKGLPRAQQCIPVLMERWTKGKAPELLSSWLLIDAKCNLLSLQPPSHHTPRPCFASHRVMANNASWLQHYGNNYFMQLWANKRQNLHFYLTQFCKPFPDNGVLKRTLWCWWIWRIQYWVLCSLSTVAGRNRLLRKTCHTRRAMEQQRPKNDNSERPRVRVHSRVNENRLSRWSPDET